MVVNNKSPVLSHFSTIPRITATGQFPPDTAQSLALVQPVIILTTV